MANFRDKSDECFDEPRYSCLSEAFHDFGVSIPKMSGKMAEAVMDDFFELLGKKNKGESSKDEPKEHPYGANVWYQEHGLTCMNTVEVVASSYSEARKKVMDEYKSKDLMDCKLIKMPDYMLEDVKDRLRILEGIKEMQK